jgi:hypothetical protein
MRLEEEDTFGSRVQPGGHARSPKRVGTGGTAAMKDMHGPVRRIRDKSETASGR